MRLHPPWQRHPHAALLAFFCYLLLALALTYPAVTRLSTGLIGQLGSDAYEGVWFVWWIGEALFRRGISPADVVVLDYPLGQHVPLILTQAHTLLLPALIALWTSPVVAYNLALLLAPAFSAFTMFLLARELTEHSAAAFVGGILFGFNPNLWGNMLGGHLSLSWMAGLPLFVLLLRRLLAAPNRRNAVGVSLAAFVAASYPTYPAYFLLPVTLVLAWESRAQLRRPEVWKALAGGALASLILLGPLYAPLLAAFREVSETNRTFGGVVENSIDIISLFIPPPDHPLVRLSPLADLARRAVNNPYEDMGYLGYVALGLAGAGLWANRGRAVLRPWIWLFVLSGVLMFGPVLKVGGDLVAVSVAGREQWFILPYAALAPLPLFGWSRVPARFIETAHVALAILGTYGAAAICQRVAAARCAPCRAWLIVGGLSLLSLGERLVAFPFASAPAFDSVVARALTAKPNAARPAVANLPNTYTANYLGLYHQTIHHRPLLGGRVFRGVPGGETRLDFVDALLRPGPEVDIAPRPAPGDVLTILAAYRVGSVVIHYWAEGYDPSQHDWLEATFGEPLAATAVEGLFVVPDSPQSAPARPVWALAPGQWSPPEEWGSAPARWFADSARLYLYLPEPQSGQMRFAVIPGWQMRFVQLNVNGHPVADYAIGDWAVYTSPILDLPAGLTVLEFVDQTGPEQLWGDLRCVNGTTLAGPFPPGLACEAKKGGRSVSAAVQAVDFVPAAAAAPLAQFGGELNLWSADLPRRIRAGDNLPVALRWQALQTPGGDYTVFVHILDAAGQIVAQHDGQPFEDNFSTRQWTPGLYVSYDLRVRLPAAVPPGRYQVVMGVYDSSTQVRLSLSGGSDDRLDLGEITVAAP